jgi:RimJ/RimL family protein N-acetyltransferase
MKRTDFLADENIVLEPLSGATEDLRFILNLRNRPEVRRWMFYNGFIPYHSHLDWYLNHYLPDPLDLMWIIHWNGRMAGAVALYNITPECAEFGRLMIHPAFRGNKIAQRTSILVRDYAFEVLNLEYIYGSCKADNTHILHVDKLTGFQVISEEDGVIYMELRRDALS